MCEFCAALQAKQRIRYPQDLAAVLLRAAEDTDKGILLDVSRVYSQTQTDSAYYVPLNECAYFRLNETGERVIAGWDDFVAHYFQCVHCGAVFHLFAETYHGSGGAWEYVGIAPMFRAA